MDKNISKNLISKYSQKLNGSLKNLVQIHLKMFQKERFKKTGETTGDLIRNEIADKSQEYRKLHHRIIQKHMKKKYLEKDTYLRKTGKLRLT